MLRVRHLGRLMAIMLAAVAAFAATNMDDIFLLALYFTQRDANFRTRHIVVGQYLGFAAILAVSLLGFVGGLVISEAVIGLLGFAPIYLGLRRLLRPPTVEPEPAAALPDAVPQSRALPRIWLGPQTYTVALVTFANGGDNISLYIPLFAGKTLAEVALVLGVFALLIAVWCYLGFRIASHPALARVLQRSGQVIVPLVLIALGVFILLENGTVEAAIALVR